VLCPPVAGVSTRAVAAGLKDLRTSTRVGGDLVDRHHSGYPRAVSLLFGTQPRVLFLIIGSLSFIVGARGSATGWA
jgi:hypothetical protein